MNLKEYALSNKYPIVKDDTLEVLKKLILDNNYTNILELGTCIGYSSIEMAKLNPMIHIDTIERNNDSYLKAIDNINKANLADQITVYNMDIKDFKAWHEYELIFVDAAKGHYKEYLENFYPYLLPYGVMVFDNISFHGIVKDHSKTHNRNTLSLVRKIQDFKDYVQDDNRFDIILDENTGDGILQVRRKKL